MQSMAGNADFRGSGAGSRRERSRSGFTLIELVVVIGVIALLVSITLVVGASVVRNGRVSKTRDAIRVMETTLTEYIADRGQIPPPTTLEPKSSHYDDDERRLVPVADAVFDVQNKGESGTVEPRLINSVGFYMLQLEASTGGSAAIKALSDDFVQLKPTYTPTSDADLSNSEANMHENGDHAGIPTVVDGWGRPLRYVHPRFHGQVGAAAQARRRNMPGLGIDVTVLLQGVEPDELAVKKIRRNKIMKEEHETLGITQRDGDGGNCVGDRPYFYSAGEDGDPSTVEGNVYGSSEPVFTIPDFAES